MRIRRLLLGIFSLIVVLTVCDFQVFADDGIKVLINGSLVNFDVQPRIINNHAIVPLRGIFEAIHFDVQWDGSIKTVSAVRDNVSIKIALNEPYAFVNGKKIELETCAAIINKRVFVPLRFIGESIGATVQWDGSSRIASISTPGVYIKEVADGVLNKNTNINYYGISYVVCASKNNIVYSSVGTKLKKSVDNGATWSDDLINIKPDYFTTGHILEDSSVVMFTNDGYIYRSIDGNKFKKVDTSGLGFIYSPLYHGIESHGNTIIAGEYGVEEGKTYRTIRSTDGGSSWQVVLAKKNPDEIRHFHSINYINGSWFLTSGDNDEQVKWWKSSDDGENWTQIKGIGGQKYRTLNLQVLSQNQIIWGSDEEKFPTIYRANIDDLLHPTAVKSLSHACWGIVGSGNVLVAITSVETNDVEKNAYIYVSKDGGQTWNEDLIWPIEGNRVFGGFRSIVGPNNLNQYMINIYGLKATKEKIYTIIMTF